MKKTRTKLLVLTLVTILLLGVTTTGVSAAASNGTAYTATQTVTLDGKPVTFQCYALKDAKGNPTNYIKLRDLAYALNGTAAQFEVGWNGQVTITTHTPYTANGSEGKTPFSGNRPYTKVTSATIVDGQPQKLDAFTLYSDSGGGFTYYKLRDLGAACGFEVDWEYGTGIIINTASTQKPEPEIPSTIQPGQVIGYGFCGEKLIAGDDQSAYKDYFITHPIGDC